MCQIDNLVPVRDFPAHTSQYSQEIDLTTDYPDDPNSGVIGRSTEPTSSAGFTYKPDEALQESSLSIRLMHKPPRAQNEFEKISDPTRQNSIYNSQVSDGGESFYISPPGTQASQEASQISSPVESDSSYRMNMPPLLRKKSGEIVKPLLKGKHVSIGVRSRSLPITPTDKQVHFGGDTDVRYFKAKDKPSTILALNSPTQVPDDEDDDDDYHDGTGHGFELEGGLRMKSLFDPNRKSYFDYFDDELNSHADPSSDKKYWSAQTFKKPSAYDWGLSHVNFPERAEPLQCIADGQFVFLENLFLSTDQIFLLGQVAVYNLDYQKSVVIRYSLDSWCTIVEMQAFYVPDSPAILTNNGYDRFMFKISLDLLVNGFSSSIDPLSTSPVKLSFELCIKYVVKHTELWDNNKGENYKFILSRESKLSSGSSNLPEGARTKQEAHKTKPKYSSSFLKRVKSDSSLATQQVATPTNGQLISSQQLSDETSTDVPVISSGSSSNASRDFENNNYYLSSPLLSSFTQNNYYTRPGKGTSNDTRQNSECYLKEKRTTDPETIPKTRDFHPDNEPKALHQISSHSQEPMSYKEFLESYCFFGSSFNDNSSKTTLVMSDGPSSHEEGAINAELSASGDSFYTVSSFLT